MKINKYKKLKNNLYEIAIDEDKYKIYDGIILRYNLLAKKEINSKELETILDDNTDYSAYYQAIKYLNTKLRTKKEIETYLKKKEFNNKLIDDVINKLEDNGYINNKIYITSYIHDQMYLSNNGPYKILNNLIKLGFDEDEILKYLDFDHEYWLEKIGKLIAKKIKLDSKNSNRELKNKIYQDLNNLGYKKESFQELIEKIQIDDKKTFKKNADKHYEKYKKKYSEPQLSYYFRGKMYSLGYDNELISEYLSNK